MFYVFAIGSMLGYALQQTLLVHHARKIDGLSLTFYRNISFVVTLLPLLIGASMADIRLVLSSWPWLMASGVAGAVFLALLYASYTFLSAGIATTVSRACSVIAVSIFGLVFFGEHLSPMSIGLIGVILLGTLALGLQHQSLPHLDNRVFLGVACAALGAIPIAFSSYILAVLSRDANPFVSGYFWETSIGVACLGLLLLRSLFFGTRIQRIDMRTLLLIAACASPTLIGTGFVVLANRGGPIGIVQAIGSGSLVVTSVLAWSWYKEKLTTGQWLSMLVICSGIAALKFV